MTASEIQLRQTYRNEEIMQREGTLRIIWTNRGQRGEPRYSVAFADPASSQGPMKPKELVGEDALRDYLVRRVNVDLEAVDSALHGLKTEGIARIFHTRLTDEQLLNLGLK